MGIAGGWENRGKPRLLESFSIMYPDEVGRRESMESVPPLVFIARVYVLVYVVSVCLESVLSLPALPSFRPILPMLIDR